MPNVWRLETEMARQHDDQAVALAMSVDYLTSRATGVLRIHSAARRTLEPPAAMAAYSPRRWRWSVG